MERVTAGVEGGEGKVKGRAAPWVDGSIVIRVKERVTAGVGESGEGNSQSVG